MKKTAVVVRQSGRADLLVYHKHTAVACVACDIERLRQWVDDLQSGMYVNCVYCGHQYGPKETTPMTMADALKRHVENCVYHPMWSLRQRLASTQAALRQAVSRFKSLLVRGDLEGTDARTTKRLVERWEKELSA